MGLEGGFMILGAIFNLSDGAPLYITLALSCNEGPIMRSFFDIPVLVKNVWFNEVELKKT